MPIELTEQQNAEPKQCGSCEFFQRRSDGWVIGICRIKLPPWVVMREATEGENENGTGARTVRDTDGCDLYLPKGTARSTVDINRAQFTRKVYWDAGAPGR